MGERVTIGVPIYRGERFLEETLHSIQRQTYKSFDVIMSVDTPDIACEAICAKFLGDPRFRMVVQPKRLGWVGQINWLISQVEDGFWYYHQQDDLTEETYVETLLEHAQGHPSASLVYCDILPFERINGPVFSAPAVLGATAFTRVMTMLHEHFPAFAFRGLTRAQALRIAGPIGVNDVNCFGADITWLTGVARGGELHRVPLPLYRKRYHDSNTESVWWTITGQDQLRYWASHCVDMLGQAIQVEGSVQQARSLWLAAAARLTAPEAAGHFLKVADLSLQDHEFLLTSFLNRAASVHGTRLTAWLDADWKTVVRWTKDSFWLPRTEPVTIVQFGPNPVACGTPFNVQPDGSSAIWIRADRRPSPGTRIRFGKFVLETVLEGTLATAKVPPEAFAAPGDVPVSLVGPEGTARSSTLTFKVLNKL